MTIETRQSKTLILCILINVREIIIISMQTGHKGCFCLQWNLRYHRITEPQNHRIAQVGRDFKGHQVQLPCNEQGHLQLDQVAQIPILLDLECLQGQGIHHSLGNLFRAVWVRSLIRTSFEDLFRDLFSSILHLDFQGGWCGSWEGNPRLSARVAELSLFSPMLVPSNLQEVAWMHCQFFTEF